MKARQQLKDLSKNNSCSQNSIKMSQDEEKKQRQSVMQDYFRLRNLVCQVDSDKQKQERQRAAKLWPDFLFGKQKENNSSSERTFDDL